MPQNEAFEALYFLTVNNTANFHCRNKNFMMMGSLLSGNHTRVIPKSTSDWLVKINALS